MRNTNFNTKTTYLAYRSEWKAEYTALSQQIRNQKNHIRSQSVPSSKEYFNLFQLRDIATFMLAELHLSKAKARQQYLASKNRSEMIVI